MRRVRECAEPPRFPFQLEFQNGKGREGRGTYTQALTQSSRVGLVEIEQIWEDRF